MGVLRCLCALEGIHWVFEGYRSPRLSSFFLRVNLEHYKDTLQNNIQHQP